MARPECPAPMTTVVTLGMARLPGETRVGLSIGPETPSPAAWHERSGPRVLPRSSTARGRAPLVTGGAAPNPSFPVRRAGHYFTSTLTWVGFVMMSYTAERFWDCATSASMSSAEASASIS